MNRNIIQVDIEHVPEYGHRIRDAKNYDEWDEYDIHTVVLDPTEITIEGTPEAIRWLYDLMEEMQKDWRLEASNRTQTCARTLPQYFGMLLVTIPQAGSARGGFDDRESTRVGGGSRRCGS